MPALHSRLTVELELTPRWWHLLVPCLTSQPKHAQQRALLAQAIAIAMELPLAQSVQVERRAFKVVVHVSRDVLLEMLARAAETCRDKLHALDVTCLATAPAAAG